MDSTDGEVVWAELSSARWDEHAFFDDAVRVDAAGTGPDRFRTTSLSHLLELPRAPQPSGLIFHLSRSGSTVLTRMLAAHSGHRVLSEPDPLDDVLRADVTADRRVELVSAVLYALARRPATAHGHSFVKADPWHVLALSSVRQACPQVPWVFVYRDPLEVLVSHQERFGIQVSDASMVEVLARYHVPIADHPPLEATARYLDAIQEGALDGLDERGRLIAHRDVPDVLPELLEHFGVVRSASEMASMLATGKADAHRPHLPYVPDGEAKRALAGPHLRSLAKGLEPGYRRLEEARSAERA